MIFNINDMLYALSFALDCVEHDVVGVTTNHGKRVAYITVAMAKRFGMSREEMLELSCAAILHDNALTEYVYEERNSGRAQAKLGSESENASVGRHCVIGEENISYMPFKTDLKGCILYHHENADGSGPFGKTAGETPLGAQLVHLADQLDARWDLSFLTEQKCNSIARWVDNGRGRLFSDECTNAFFEGTDYATLEKIQTNKIDVLVYEMLPQESRNYSEAEMISLSQLFARIVDYKSEFTRRHSIGIAEKAKLMAENYGYSSEKTARLYLAGALHDIGKLVIDKDILEKPDKLTDEEFRHIKNHAFATYDILRKIKGMDEICAWASLHHEKLDGSGYPFRKTEAELTHEEKLMCCLDIYQALTEERPYKEGFSHEKSIAIMRDMAQKHKIDGDIVENIDRVFA